MQPLRISRKGGRPDSREPAVIEFPEIFESPDKHVSILIAGDQETMVSVEWRVEEVLLPWGPWRQTQFRSQEFASVYRWHPVYLGAPEFELGHAHAIGGHQAAQQFGELRAVRVNVGVPDLHA